MDNNGYYTGKHSSYMLPPVNYQVQYDSFTDYQPSIQQTQQQQHHQQLPHQVQTTHQQHHDIQSTISVKLDTINKSPSQKNDEIQACTGGYTGNNSATSANDFHSNLYHYNKSLDNSDGIAAYNQTPVVSNYTDFDHIGGSIGQKSLNSFLLPQQHQSQLQQHQSNNTHNQQQQQQSQSHNQHPPTAAIIPQAIGNVQNDISQQSKVLGTFDQRSSSKCYNSKATAGTNSLHSYQQTGYKDTEMSFNYNKLPPIPQTYHHVYPSYDKYSLQPRSTSHHKSYDDNPNNSRPYVCQTMPMATNHKPASQSELFCSSSATTEQHNRFTNRNYLFPNSAFTAPANGYFAPMYHRPNNVHRNISLPPPLQPAIEDSSNYYHNNNLLARSGSYNRSQVAFQQSHYPYARSHHPIPIPKLQSKSEIDIMSGLTEDIYHRPYNVGYDHYEDFQFSQIAPSVTHYPTKSSKVIYAPYSSNSVTSNYSPSTTAVHQQQPQPQQQQHHHQSVIQNQVLSSNDYTRYSCSNVQPPTVNCPNKVYLQDQYTYASHPQMVYSHGTNDMIQTELPKYNQTYDKHSTAPTELIDLEEQITGSKILKTRELAPTSSLIYNYNVVSNSYQRGMPEDPSKNQSLRDYLATWNDDEEDEGGDASNGKKSNSRRLAAGQSKLLDLDSASSVSTTKIHFGIKVDNGGVPTKNLPDIIIDIEKPKVVGSDDSYSPVTDKLYVLESIDVPFADLNKYKHLSVVNKLPDNIVQIERRKGDSLDEVEETLKLIEKCEERVRQHKSNFELDKKFESGVCPIPIRGKCDVGHDDADPLSINEIPLVDPVPAPSPEYEPDEENSSIAHDKTADDGQDDNYIGDEEVETMKDVEEVETTTDVEQVGTTKDDEEDETMKVEEEVETIKNDEEVETMNDGDGEVVRYKCVQKKVSTNGDELIHSDISIPKLKIKILRRKKSKSLRNRKYKNVCTSFDAHEMNDSMNVDDVTNRFITLKSICLDVINTTSFRKYLISMKANELQNIFQHSGQTSIQNNVECDVELEKDDELINESANEMPSDLIENKNLDLSPVEKNIAKTETPSCDDNCIEKLPTTFDNADTSGNPSRFDYFPLPDAQLESSVDCQSLRKFRFHTPSVGDDFSDSNFEAISNINMGNDVISLPIKSDDTNPFFRPTNNEPTIETTSPHVDCFDAIETECSEKISDKCVEPVMDSRSVESLIDNLEKTQSVPSNRVEDSELMESLNQFEELIGNGNESVMSVNNSTDTVVENGTSVNLNETQVSASKETKVSESKEAKDEVNLLEGITTVFKTEPIKSDYSDSSSSSCSSSDDSNDSDFHSERKISGSETKSPETSTPATNNQDRVSHFSSSSSDESEDEEVLESKLKPQTESDVVNAERSFSEPDVVLTKVKIENEETVVHPKVEEPSSDNEFKSSSCSSSCSGNSEESSTDSDDNASDSNPNNEKSPDDLPFIVTKIKIEETPPYTDSTDESSTESFDETESETANKNVATHDSESVKSNSSSDSSDDESVDESITKSDLTPNDVRSSKTSSDTEPSEEEDKKSCSSSPSAEVSVADNRELLIESLIEPHDTFTPKVRKDSSTNSEEKYVEQNADIRSSQVTEHFIKSEPINEDSRACNSSSDNSDDEYVKLSPLNSDLLDECSLTNKHVRKFPHLSNKNVVMNPVRRKFSSDGYSTSTSSSSSSSSSQSTSSDEYSSDDDNVFEPSTSMTVQGVSSNVQLKTCELATCFEELENASEVNEELVENCEANEELEGNCKVNEELVDNCEVNEELEGNCEVNEELVDNCEVNEKLGDNCEVNEELADNCEGNAELIDNCEVNEELDDNCEVNAELIDNCEVNEELDDNCEVNAELIDNCEVNEELDDNCEVDEELVGNCEVNEKLGNNCEVREEIVDLSESEHTPCNDRSNEDDDGHCCTEEYIEDSLVDSVTEIQHQSSPDTSRNEASVDTNVVKPNSIEALETIRSDSKELIDDVVNSSHNENDQSQLSSQTVVEVVIETKDIEIDSLGTLPEESIVFNNKEEVSVSDDLNPKIDLEDENLVKQNESRINLQDSNHESTASVMEGPIPDSLAHIDFVDSGVSLPSNESINSDTKIVETAENLCDNKTSDVEKNGIDISANPPFNVDVSEGLVKEIETTENSIRGDARGDVSISNLDERKEAEVTTLFSTNESTKSESISQVIESKNGIEEHFHEVEESDKITSPTVPKDLIYPVLDIPVKLIPLPGEIFNEELYQALIDNSEIFAIRKIDTIENFEDFYSKIPVELIPLPGEMLNEKAPDFLAFKRKYLVEQKLAKSRKSIENLSNSKESDLNVVNQEVMDPINNNKLKEDPRSAEDCNRIPLVISDSVPSLKVLCEKVLCLAEFHYEGDNEIATAIDGDSDNISYLYILSDNDDFWNCSTESSPPLLVCYDGELEDDVFVESEFSAPISVTETIENLSEKCSVTSQNLSVDSFTIDSHDIQYEEIVPVNRTMYKLETFKRYLQSKYIQKPNYIQTHCINKILKKYSNYQRYRKKYSQATVQKCKKRIENFTNLFKYPKCNETSPKLLATDRYTVNDNGTVPKNDVLRSNCDINKSKLLLLTNNNLKSKRNLNSTTERSHKLKESEVSAISSYVSEMTKNNHLKESRAFAKEIITNKRPTKLNAKVTGEPIVKKPKAHNLLHGSPPNQIAIPKRKVSDSVDEPMTTRNNKKRKISFDDTLLGINRFYRQNSLIAECDKIEMKSSSSNSRLKERSNVYSNSNILNNSKDKVKRLIIPKSKIFDGPNIITKNNCNSSVQVPYVKLVRNPFIDSLGKSYAKNIFKPVNLK